MDERTILMGEYLTGGYSVSDLARRRGISRKTVYKWIERYKQSGWAGLEDQSRAPHHQAQAISQAMERRILAFKEQWPKWGAPKLHAKLQESGDCPSESTVGHVLARHGLTRKRRRRLGATPSAKPLSHCQGPNQVWCADFKGWFRTGDGLRCDPLTLTDAHTRYLLCCQGIGTSTGLITVKPLLEVTFREFGLPEAIRTDNGPPFASTGLAGLTELSVWWLTLGIRVERITPGHPEENGRHERMHRTLKEATAQPPEGHLRAQQRAFDAFQREYNEQRPHEALGQKPPASLYVPSSRDYPERLVPWDYADDWQKRQISPGGQMRWKGQKVNLSRALIGHTVGLEPVAEGVWSLYFRNLQLGQWDERHGRLLPARVLVYA